MTGIHRRAGRRGKRPDNLGLITEAYYSIYPEKKTRRVKKAREAVAAQAKGENIPGVLE
jgi:hypothetical protein